MSFVLWCAEHNQQLSNNQAPAPSRRGWPFLRHCSLTPAGCFAPRLARSIPGCRAPRALRCCLFLAVRACITPPLTANRWPAEKGSIFYNSRKERRQQLLWAQMFHLHRHRRGNGTSNYAVHTTPSPTPFPPPLSSTWSPVPAARSPLLRRCRAEWFCRAVVVHQRRSTTSADAAHHCLTAR